MPALRAALATMLAVRTQAPAASALERARRLSDQLPRRADLSTSGGEAELASWWSSHEKVLAEARREYGTLHAELYDVMGHEEELLHQPLLQRVRACEHAARHLAEATDAAASTAAAPSAAALLSALRDAESALRSLLTEVAPGVWRLRLFSPRFCKLMQEELSYQASK